MVFHSVCGERITFYNNNTTASRNISDFNNGLVFSRDPLPVNTLFQIKIERKIYTWSGGLEFGVTKCDPDYVVLPTNATDLKNGTWILSGSSVLKDGRSLLDIYSLNLNTIDEGDVVGVMRTDQDELVFSLNGELKGVAAHNIPKRVFVVIDLYGQVSRASVVINESNDRQIASMPDGLDIDIDNEERSNIASNAISNYEDNTNQSTISQHTNDVVSTFNSEKLRFHSKSGSLAKISCNGRTAERLRPLDEFNNGVVMTHRPLSNNELFEIRIDRLVEKWSGSIEVGVTTHNPDLLNFPPTMTNLKTGTIMMSGCGILTNGKATMRDFGDFNLDELMIGDRIGLIRKCNGNLHYVINGLDQGCAASNAPEPVWGVVDLYGRTVKVTIVDKDEKEEQNLITRRNTVLRNGQSLTDLNAIVEDVDERLSFHTRCGAHAAVINNNQTAYRPNSYDDFNNGVVITHRPLQKHEVFEVRIDKIVTKWAGSIEIGVTTHSPTDIEYPSTMTNIRSGTWMMTGNGVMHNGTTVIDDYGTNLDRLQVGDRVGVVIKDKGSLHFFVNGVDQGEAACNLPNCLYGVIDLYGQAAQATIVDHNLICCCNCPYEAGFPHLILNHTDLHFHHIHGKNVRICNGGRIAVRPYGFAEFTDAVVLANRPLKSNEIFAIRVEKVIDKWSGSLEIGVTTNRPDDFELPATITDLEQDIWLLSGSTIMQNGEVIKHEYQLNLDTLAEGMIIGLMRHNDKTLHFYLNEVDQGEACTDVPSVIYPIVDLYGQCAQVSIVSPPEHKFETNGANNMQTCLNWIDDEPITTTGTLVDDVCSEDTLHRGFNSICGKNIILRENDMIATRDQGHEYGIVFSKMPLKTDRLFEVRLTKWSAKYAGYISIGVTTSRIERNLVPSSVSLLTPDIWYLLGDEVWYNGRLLKPQYCHDLHWLQAGSSLGVKRTSDNALHFYINGQDQGVAVQDLPPDLYVVVDVYGSATEIMAIKEINDTSAAHVTNHMTSLRESFISTTSSITQDTKELDDLKLERAKMKYYLAINQISESNSFDLNADYLFADRGESPFERTFFTELRGRNIRLFNNNKSAVRVESYNQGLVIISKPLPRNSLFQVVIENLNPRWVSSLFVGILCHPLLRSSLPTTALGLKKDAWFFGDDSVYHNGNKIKSRYGLSLEHLVINQRVGVLVDLNNQLRLFIDGIDQGVAASDIPLACFVAIDLYGQCEQISIVNPEAKLISSVTEVELVQDNDASVRNEVSCHDDLSACEKADLEHHEKESPSSEEHEVTESRVKLNKTNENIMTMSSSSMISSAASLELDRKSIASTENLSLQQYELKQIADISRHMSTTNCDHKTSLNIANATYIQAEKSNGKSKNSPLTRSLTACFPPQSASTPIMTSTINERFTASTAIPSSFVYKTNPNCEYRINCLCLRSHLGIPEEFFVSNTSVVCYCKSCSLNNPIPMPKTNKGSSDLSVPSCTVPIGWCKFPIKTHLMTNNVDSFTLEKWHVTFVATSFAVIRKVLDTGRLSALETFGIIDKKRSKQKADSADPSEMILSPSIAYATSSRSLPRYKYKDRSTNTRYQCSAAFQVLCHPEAYQFRPSAASVLGTSVTSSECNETVTLQSVEGSHINEDDVTVISALLFKMERL